MTLPHSGAISLAMIAAEFGGAAPYKLSNYYAGGPNVPSGTTGDSGAIPTAGALAFSKFYGASKFIPHSTTFTASGSDTIQPGCVQLIIETWSKGGDGGHGATGSDDHQGGGGSSGAYAKSIITVIPADYGKTITVTISAGDAQTSGPTVNGSSVATHCTPGNNGFTATGTTNGAGSTSPGAASGGNTTNTNGSNGTGGNTGGTGGIGGAKINGLAGGGNGGFSSTDIGWSAGDGATIKITQN